MNLKIITAPATELVTLTEAKKHLRVTDTVDDLLITSLIKVARQDCENFTNRALISTTFELILDDFPKKKIVLPMPPVESIISIKYKDCDSIETTIASTDYIFYSNEPAIIMPDYGITWPSFTPYPIGAVKIRFVAGYKTTSSDSNLLLPEPIKQAILLLIGHYYENREAVNIGNIVNKLPFSVGSLLYPYRIWSLS